MEIPDILIETLCTTALFIVLELTIIIPLIKKAFSEEVNTSLIPKMKEYINSQISDFSSSLIPTITDAVGNAAKDLWTRIRGRRGGSRKGVNAFVDRVLEGEDPDEIAASYSADVVESGLSILEAVADRFRSKKEKTEEQPAGSFLSEVN